MPCTHIPLTDLRSNRLREFIRGILTPQGVPLEEVYVAVARHFGDDVRQPEIGCGHYDNYHPEFHHLIRWTLQDGKADGEFDIGPKGRWRRHPDPRIGASRPDRR
ncbi:MAG TPA: hypothetical protein VEB22_07480 [Phycisphaerales bacterium]|nr:hypothetical protein [Phycisphaerales bacterium]